MKYIQIMVKMVRKSSKMSAICIYHVYVWNHWINLINSKRIKKILLFYLKLDILKLITGEMWSSQLTLKLYFPTTGIKCAPLLDYGRIWHFQELKNVEEACCLEITQKEPSDCSVYSLHGLTLEREHEGRWQ